MRRRKRVDEILREHGLVTDAQVASLLTLVEVVDHIDHAARGDVVKLTNRIIVDAVKRRAREIVVEARAKELVVSYALADGIHDVMHPPLALAAPILTRLRAMGRGRDWFTLKGVIDVDLRLFPSRFGAQMSLRLFGPEPQPLDVLALPSFATAARLEPDGVVHLRTARGWRPTWTYPPGRHAAVVAEARLLPNVDVTEDACASGARLFLQKHT